MKVVKKTAKHFTYILQCADQTLYIGYTTDLEKRLHAHNNLKNGAHYTKIRRPVVLKYREIFKTLGEARSREAELKRWTRAEKMLLINKKSSIISGMAKRASQDIKPRTSRSKKTKKRLAAKRVMLAAKKKKK